MTVYSDALEALQTELLRLNGGHAFSSDLTVLKNKEEAKAVFADPAVWPESFPLPDASRYTAPSTSPYPRNVLFALWTLAGSIKKIALASGGVFSIAANTPTLLICYKYIDEETWVPKIIDDLTYQASLALQVFLRVATTDPEAIQIANNTRSLRVIEGLQRTLNNRLTHYAAHLQERREEALRWLGRKILWEQALKQLQLPPRGDSIEERIRQVETAIHTFSQFNEQWHLENQDLHPPESIATSPYIESLAELSDETLGETQQQWLDLFNTPSVLTSFSLQAELNARYEKGKIWYDRHPTLLLLKRQQTQRTFQRQASQREQTGSIGVLTQQEETTRLAAAREGASLREAQTAYDRGSRVRTTHQIEAAAQARRVPLSEEGTRLKRLLHTLRDTTRFFPVEKIDKQTLESVLVPTVIASLYEEAALPTRQHLRAIAMSVLRQNLTQFQILKPTLLAAIQTRLSGIEHQLDIDIHAAGTDPLQIEYQGALADAAAMRELEALQTRARVATEAHQVAQRALQAARDNLDRFVNNPSPSSPTPDPLENLIHTYFHADTGLFPSYLNERHQTYRLFDFFSSCSLRSDRTRRAAAVAALATAVRDCKDRTIQPNRLIELIDTYKTQFKPRKDFSKSFRSKLATFQEQLTPVLIELFPTPAPGM